jgi:hypothetical protein
VYRKDFFGIYLRFKIEIWLLKNLEKAHDFSTFYLKKNSILAIYSQERKAGGSIL